MAIVSWVKSVVDSWLPLETVDLTNVSATGVYVIWHGSSSSFIPWTVRVGQGDIADRLTDHRSNPLVTQYRQRGLLMVTWAEVPKKADRDGIERFLANHYGPLVGDAWPDVNPIPVNLIGA